MKKVKFFSKIGKEARVSIAYLVSYLLLRGMGIITLPFFSRRMTLEQMGHVTIYNTWNSIFSAIATLSLDSGSFNVAMLEFECDRDKYQSSILTLSTLSSIVFSLFILGLYPYIKNIININQMVLPIMFSGFIFQPAMTFWLLRQRYEMKYRASSIVTVTSSIFGSVVSMVAVYYARSKGVESLSTVRIVSMNLVVLIYAITLYVLTMRRGKLFYNKHYWNYALRLSIPLIFHTLSKHALDASDKIMIGNLVGQREVGIYGVLVSLSSLGGVVWAAINASLIPFMFRKMKAFFIKDDKNAKIEINKVIMPLMIFYALVCLLLCLAAPEVVAILTTSEYYAAVVLMPPIAAGIFFQSLYNIYSNILLYFKKTNLVMVATIVAALFNIITNLIFIPIFGYIAASYTTLLSYILLALMQYLFGMKVSNKIVLIDNKAWIISLLLSVICICIIPLYPFPIVRYVIAVLLIVSALLGRKRILTALVMTKNEKNSEINRL